MWNTYSGCIEGKFRGLSTTCGTPLKRQSICSRAVNASLHRQTPTALTLQGAVQFIKKCRAIQREVVNFMQKERLSVEHTYSCCIDGKFKGMSTTCGTPLNRRSICSFAFLSILRREIHISSTSLAAVQCTEQNAGRYTGKL